MAKGMADMLKGFGVMTEALGETMKENMANLTPEQAAKVKKQLQESKTFEQMAEIQKGLKNLQNKQGKWA